MSFRIFQKSSDHGSHRVSSLQSQGHDSSFPNFCRSSYHLCCFNTTKQKQDLRSMCPHIPNPHKQILQPPARRSTHCQKTGSQPPLAAELDSACYCLSPILQSHLHFLWIVTCQSQYWSAKNNSSFTEENQSQTEHNPMTQRGNIQSHGGHRLPTVCPVTKVSPFFRLTKTDLQ